MTTTTSTLDDARRAYDSSYRDVTAQDLGKQHDLLIGDERRGGELFADTSPADTSIVVGRFVRGTVGDMQDAISQASVAYRDWRRTPWAERIRIVRDAAAIIEAKLPRMAATLTYDIGKNWTDAMYDVQECVDIMRYYSDQMEDRNGFDVPISDGTRNDPSRSVMRPRGAWVVISPFNFEMALAGGPASAALVAGNTVVLKPAEQAPHGAYFFAEALIEAGAPPGVVNVVTGRGSELGSEIVSNPGVAGVVFTGSEAVGRWLQEHLVPKGVPVIAEMGGKNPAIVMPSANLDDAAHGIARSAFGFAGQKCSANSRVFVHRQVFDAVGELIIEHATRLPVGLPEIADTVVGPLIDQSSVDRYFEAVDSALAAGGSILLGGERPTDPALSRGHFVTPALVTGLPIEHPLLHDELFAPFTVLVPVTDLQEAISLANDSNYGLTAGIYTRRDAELDLFLDEIEAGVIYVNRRTGATTGARVGVQTFGGWKASGSSNANSYGPYYLSQFMREQSRTFGTASTDSQQAGGSPRR